MQYEVLDISGDAGIKAYGKTCEEAFANAGMGMYSLITDIGNINERQEIGIEVKSDSIEGLLVSFLNELIFRFDTYGFIGNRIEVMSLKFGVTNKTISKAPSPSPSPAGGEGNNIAPPLRGGDKGEGDLCGFTYEVLSMSYELKAKIYGEEFDIDRHERRLLVKAATYHNIRVEKTGDKWEVEVIFDI
ncbi:MAG: archease [Nitrospirae bacterium]|nr:archease [Nitrospirota bacterium]